ncbi:MAG: hypothetical protein ACD_20C00361G0001 [uncultured bacterium]|nr:MAG: hypothetical protein ACD_20C00361G0001 [uncultured bacterium]
MVAKRMTPLLLAASVLVCGFSGGFINQQAAYAITSVDELTDVSESVWAYDALKDLVEKYNVIEGYPDKTFRGARTASRYELAAALNATVKAIGKDLARLGAEKASKEDLATVARLQQEFAREIQALNARAEALEARATKIEAKNDEQDNRLAILEKMKIYGDVSFGGYADIAGNPADEFTDAISGVGRARFNVDYAAVEDKGGAIVGPGTIHTRLVAAFGRVAPLEAGTDIVEGGTYVARNRYSGASAIAGDSSFFNEGIRSSDYISLTTGTAVNSPTPLGLAAIAGGDTRANAYLDSAYYSQVLRAQIPGMPESQDWRTSFTTHVGLIPWRDIFYKTPYQGNENVQFQNTALINNPAILTDFTLPRVAIEINQGLGRWANLALRADAFSLDVSKMMNGIGFTGEGDVGYNLGFLDEVFGTQNMFNMSGNVFGGYYLVDSNNGLTNNLINVTTTMDGAVDPTDAGQISINGGTGDVAQGFYAGINQEIFRGIGAFGSFALNNLGSNSALLNALQNGTGTNIVYNNSTLNGTSIIYGIRQAFTAGVEIPVRALPNFLTFGARQRDTLGFGWSRIYPNDAAGSPATVASGATLNVPDDPENVIEGYYRLQVNDNFALIPSAQLIFSRMGDEDNEVNIIIGLRSSFTF